MRIHGRRMLAISTSSAAIRSSRCILLAMFSPVLSVARSSARFHGVRPTRFLSGPLDVQQFRHVACSRTIPDLHSVGPPAARIRAAHMSVTDGPSADLEQVALKFLQLKNEGDLASIFQMVATDADIYGLRGSEIESGLGAFFESHQELHHELVGQPESVAPMVVQYRFVKTWVEDGAVRRWVSGDPEKPRNKVERITVDANGKLLCVEVVEADAAVKMP
uniref:SnoaL-like domain-containing protein n=1 Tax=Chrysotila carterae TaxID=13221 RepID=A0A7S4B330_CHRCT